MAVPLLPISTLAVTARSVAAVATLRMMVVLLAVLEFVLKLASYERAGQCANKPVAGLLSTEVASGASG